MKPIPAMLLAALLASSCDRGPAAPPPDLASAEAKMEAGRFGEALREVRAIDPADLPSPADRLRAARVAEKGRDYALALRILSVDDRSGSAPAPGSGFLRAEALLRTGDLEGAGRALAAMERAGLRTERWRFLFALLTMVRDSREIGAREIEDLAAGGSRDPDVLLRWVEVGPQVPREIRRRLGEALDRASDRGPVLAAFGAWVVRGNGDPSLALLYLEEAVRRRPWDRAARLDLVRSLLGRGGEASVGRACDEAESVCVQDPGDAEGRLLLAQAWGERGRLAVPAGAALPPPAAVRAWDRAEKEYGILLGGKGLDPATAIRALQGIARIHVEEIPLDPPGRALGPGTHHARAAECLDRAAALDPEGKLPGGPHGTRLLAETRYLRGRAARKAHTGNSDHTEALGWFRKAFEADPGHLDASWDLGLLCHDFFPDSKEYRDLAADAFSAHLLARAERGLPPLDPARQALVQECLKKAGRRAEFHDPTRPPPPPVPPR